MTSPDHEKLPISDWVRAHVPPAPVTATGASSHTALDLACGAGRHSLHLASLGYRVTAVDIDIDAIQALEHSSITSLRADLETDPWPLGEQRFDLIVVTNYLHRPLFPTLFTSLKADGKIVYETFMVGNEAYGRPRSPAFLLREGELLEALGAHLAVDAFEQGYVDKPRPAVTQRIVATRRDR